MRFALWDPVDLVSSLLMWWSINFVFFVMRSGWTPASSVPKILTYSHLGVRVLLMELVLLLIHHNTIDCEGTPPSPGMFIDIFKDFAEALGLFADSLRDFNAVYYDDALMHLLYIMRKRFLVSSDPSTEHTFWCNISIFSRTKPSYWVKKVLIFR